MNRYSCPACGQAMTRVSDNPRMYDCLGGDHFATLRLASEAKEGADERGSEP